MTSTTTEERAGNRDGPTTGPARARPRICVAVSGGVDSAVALALLKRGGHRVRALFMKNWEEDDTEGHCAAADDLADARRVCDALGVPLATVNLATEYWERVFAPFLDEHRRGHTPNPDVMCNRAVKFDAFVEHARDLGADLVATGHYARTEQGDGGQRLLRGVDPAKDQSYFLHRLDQGQLAAARFPLGRLTKTEVRRLAREAGLDVAAKRDSTGICFIGERPFRQFLQRFIPPRPGPIESVDGARLGEHDGLSYYTIGQRRGLAIGGRRGGSGAPWYVVAKDAARDCLVVAQGRDHPALHAREVLAGDAHWVAGRAPPLPLRCAAKVRYRQGDQGCVVEAAGGHRLRVVFATPQWAVAPGQSVVFYRDAVCLGGAIIEASRA